jgi:hypothetical protein
LFDHGATDLVTLPLAQICIRPPSLERFENNRQLLAQLRRNLAKFGRVYESSFAVRVAGVALEDEVVF